MLAINLSMFLNQDKVQKHFQNGHCSSDFISSCIVHRAVAASLQVNRIQHCVCVCVCVCAVSYTHLDVYKRQM